MRGTKLITTLLLSAFLFAGCGLRPDAVIKVNNKVITQREFNKEFDKQVKGSYLAALGIDVKSDHNSVAYLMLQGKVANELIIKTLLEEEMAKRGIKVKKEDVDKTVKDVIDKVGSKEQLEATLKQNGLTTAQFRQGIEEEIKMKKLAEQLGNSDVSTAEAKKFYKENPDKFKYPEKVRASHILISTDPAKIQEVLKAENKKLSKEELSAKINEEIAARKAKADKLATEAKADIASFARIARENSDDTVTAEKGGDLGFFAKQEMLPEFAKVAFAQRPNTVSPVVKTMYGYHIILVTDRMAAGQVPFEKAEADIKNYLTNQKQINMLDNLLESLKKNANIEFKSEEYNPQIIQAKMEKMVQEQKSTMQKALQQKK